MIEALKTSGVNPCDKQALGFLKLLDPTTNEFCFRTFDDVKVKSDTGQGYVNRGDKNLLRKINGSLNQSISELRELNSKGAGVFVVINKGGHQKSDITEVRAAFADTDGAPLEPLLTLQPHIVVETSEGNWHAYWLVKNCSLEQFGHIQSSIAQKYGTDPSVKDLPRVMRVPGFFHNKQSPFLSNLIIYNHDLDAYTVDSLCSGLDINIEKNLAVENFSDVANLLPTYVGKFSSEKLGAKNAIEPYIFSAENALNYLNAAKAAYPNGLTDFAEYKDFGLMCAELKEVQGWPDIEAYKILEDVGSNPIGASRTNNDTLWESFKESTRSKNSLGTPIQGHRSLFALAIKNGWKPFTHNIPKWLEEMNEEFFVSPFSTSVAIFRKTNNEYVPLKPEAFGLLVKNRSIEIDSGNIKKNVSISGEWLKHQNRRQYSGVGFWPGMVAPKDCFNFWQGWPVKPVPGDIQPAIDHIKQIICNGNTELFRYVLGWLAYCVQHPFEPGYVALVIMGGRGTGKTMFSEWIKAIFGKHAMSIANGKLLTGTFTGHLQNLVLVVAEEAFWAGDKPAENALKHLITGTTLTIHPKGYAPYDAPNYLHVIMTSNEDWVVPAGVDERRFAVCSTSNSKKGDFAYFNNLAKWAENGGISALLDYLLKYDLKNFNVRKPPDTEGLRDQKLMSLDPVTRWIMHRLEVGAMIGSEWKQEASASLMVNNLCEHQQLNIHERRRAETVLGNTLRRIFEGTKKIRKRVVTTRETVYHFPVATLMEARLMFEKFIGFDNHNWGDEV